MNEEKFQQLLRENFSKENSFTPYRAGNIACIYNRVSTKEQMDSGNSLTMQGEMIEKYAGREDYSIKIRFGGTYESAKTDERKEFQKMLDYVQKDKSISTILVYSYDRFSRSGANGIYLLENLKKLGVKLVAVTQEIDSTTATGNFQQNLYMLLSKLDNDMRKDKCISGTKSLVQKGYWPYSTPRGYTNTNKFTTADKHVYVVNEEGKILRNAFVWKASGKFTNQQIVEKLALLGVKVNIRYLGWILANPFYCGYVSVSLMPGQVFKGKHPALIDKETFLQANNISRENPRFGVKKIREKSELPLKIFMRDAVSGSPLTGYHNKKKNLFYYKSIKDGTRLSISAKNLNQKFESAISLFEYDPKYQDRLRKILLDKLKSKFSDDQANEKNFRKKIAEVKGQLEKVEERFVLGEITKEQHVKYSSLYGKQIEAIEQEIDQSGKISSNLELAVEKGLKYAQNLRQLWVSSDYHEKQRLQYLVFPEGMMYNKQKDEVLTTRINSIFGQIALLSMTSRENQKGNPLADCLFGSHVVPTGIEPVSSV